MIWNWKYQIIAVIAIIFFVGCKSRDAIIDNKEYASLEKIVDSRNFEVQNNWALPLRGNQINLIGNDNFINFSNDSVSLFLPYFGVRQMAGGYNSVAGIEYNGLLQEYQIDKNKDENSIEIYFETNQKTESLNFRLTLYDGGNSRLRVFSTQRDNISYTGNYYQGTKQK